MDISIQSAGQIQPVKREFREYTPKEKSAWAKQNAAENAKYLSDYLGFEVSPRLPFVLLQAAFDVVNSVRDRSRLGVHICQRADHYVNTVKVLATAIVHYDLAANLVGTRDRVSGALERCENSLFADLLKLPSRTVDNCIYSLKRSGLYLSFEQREEKDGEPGVYRGVASIKRLNMTLFEILGLGSQASIQRGKAKQRQQLKKVQRTPAEVAFEEYKQCDDKVRERRNQQRADAKAKKQSQLAVAQSKNRTKDILAYVDQGMTYQEACDLVKSQSALDVIPLQDPLDDIPY